MKRIALVILVLAASATAASAYDYNRGDRIDGREAAQARRIEHGVRDGQLTWYETLRLRAEQARIYAMERLAKRDGYIDGREARRIERAQNAADRDIYGESHDRQTAWRRHQW
jgi:uncharacterized membrane protein YebE (DUF533 family)